MDTPSLNNPLQKELSELLVEMKKHRHEAEVKSKILIAQADQLINELEKTNFSELDKEEKRIVKDLRDAVAEEVASLELEEGRNIDK